jgi:uncharacterized membrane protein YgcG/predicted Zn-dependent protease
MIQLKYVKLFLIAAAVNSLFIFASLKPTAQSKFPARQSHVNDFASVLDTKTRNRLENILENLQRKTGVQFDLATVQSTTGQDIFDFSKRLASDWNIGARTSQKSLLLVVSVDDKTSFTQFSRSVQPDLPEGVLGEMAQRMRARLQMGHIGAGLTDVVEVFANALGRKLAFTLKDLDENITTVAEAPKSIDNPAPPAEGQSTPDITVPVVLTSAGGTRPRIVKQTPTPEPVAVVPEPAAALSDDDADEEEEVELTLTLPLAERITKLKEFMAENGKSKYLMRANELLVSAHAALGDSLLANRDSASGVEQLMLAIEEAPVDASEKLYSGVISQIPMNLYLRDERVSAFEAAQKIEEKFGDQPHHLLALTNFYLGIERGDEAARLSEKALVMNPNLAEAHYSLGLARHISLRLDEAAAEYKRALELDSSFRPARRSLADLNRASGKADEALAFYREQVSADPKDRAARTGLVLSLLDLSRKEEAEQELESALKDDPKNVTLLSGAAYWFAAHRDTKRALELATRAVKIEPRYTWSQIALARALVGEGQPLAAERALRFARQYGKFPTLDYELANVLASAGLYEEAAEVLTHSFVLTDNELETRLAGRMTKRADNFVDLLSPERQASLFQATGADTPQNARMLKALLAFTLAVRDDAENGNQAALVSSAREFAAGTDRMQVYRQLYVASRLLRLNRALEVAQELTEAARSGVEEALDVPAVTVAVQADELRDIRARAIADGGTPDIPDAPRNVLSDIMRGRIEDLFGWLLFNQDRYPEAADHLQRAANILPEGTPSWRTAMWHLGAALEQTDKKEDALNAYIKSYISGEPDLARRALIERLYVKLNGSSEGLDQRIGPSPESTTAQLASEANSTAPPVATPPTERSTQTTETATPSESPVPPTETPSPSESPASSPSETPDPSPSESPAPPTETPSPTETPDPSPSESPAPPTETPSPTETPDPSPSESPAPPTETPSPTENPAPSPSESPVPSPSESPAPPTETPSPTPEPEPAPSPSTSPTVAEAPRPVNPEPTLDDLPAQPPSSLRLIGRIRDAAGNGIANVVVVLISPGGTVLASTTDAEGNYSFTVSPSGKPFRLVPSKDGFAFDPIDRSVVMSIEDRRVMDFVGKEQP